MTQNLPVYKQRVVLVNNSLIDESDVVVNNTKADGFD